jgi:hypothetical protein
VSRTLIITALGFVLLTTSPLSFGQTRDRRLEDAQSDIKLLKRVVEEQGRRIAELEKTVKVLQTEVAVSAGKPAAEERVKAAQAVSTVPWQIPFAWTRIKTGMSRAQVEEILGAPTSVDSVIDYQTLVYKDDASGPRTISGSVKLVDDRVSQVNPPAF